MIEPIKSAYLGPETESPQLVSEYLEIKESYRFSVITYSSLIIIRNGILSLYRAVQHLSPPLFQFLLIIPSFSLQPSPFASSSSFLSMLCKLPLPFPTHHNSFSEIAKKISKISHSNFIPKCSSFQETSFSDNLSLERFGVECASDSCQVNPVLSSIRVKCCLKSLKSKLLVSIHTVLKFPYLP